METLNRDYNRRVLFAASCVAMLIFGIVMAVLGAVLPSLIITFGLEMGYAGSFFTLLTLGMLVGSLIFGPLVDRFGYKWVLVLSTAIIFLGFLGMALAPVVLLLTVSLVLIGFGGGVINGGANALVADTSIGPRGAGLSFLGVFFGIGAFGIPLVLGSLLDIFTYRAIIATVGTLFLLPMLFFLFLRYPRPKHAAGFPVAEALRLTKEKPLLLFGAILFLQSGLEMTVGGWTATYMQDEMGATAQRAVIYLSLYWLGMTVARIGIGSVLERIGSARILYISLLVSFTGALLLLLAPSAPVAVIGAVLLGAGFAAVFPVTLGLVGDAYSHLSGTAFSMVLAIGLLGGMSIPWMTGITADSVGLRTALYVIPVALTGILLLFRVVHARGAGEEEAAGGP